MKNEELDNLNIIIGTKTDLTKKEWKDIGTKRKNKLNLVGKTFGRLKIIREVDKKEIGYFNSFINKSRFWLCKCKCGNEKINSTGALTRKIRPVLSCGCLTKEIASKIFRKKPFEWLFNRFIRISKIDKKDVKITYDDFLEFTKQNRCHYCNANINWQNFSHKNKRAYHLDRKNNNEGYTKENCVVCCSRCNHGKTNKFSYEEWYGMTEYFRKLN